MSNPERDNKAPDQFEQWRDMRDSYLEAWSKAMMQGVNTDAYAKATGAVLDAYLTASMPFREALEKAMVQALQQLSMPTRTDILSLAERLTNLEMRLDDLDSKLDRIEKLVAKPASAKLETRLDELVSKLEHVEKLVAKPAAAVAPPSKPASKKGSV